MKRRTFIQRASASGLLFAGGQFPLRAFAGPAMTKLTILHTNDVHSRVEPFPMDGGRYQGMGGAVRRAGLIQSIRKSEEHVLLFDSGDIFQGTPYFNFYGGELEFKLMSQMRYDAATIGNHDFDAGIDGLYKQLPHANFPFVCANYDFSDTIMNGNVKPYLTKQRGDIKIGILGVGIELNGLVPKALYKDTQYLDPIAKANEYATHLKYEEKCDLVICLSHLGYQYNHNRVSDIVLAQSSENIDIILGGHTHTFLEEPHILANAKGDPVWINQVGWGGIMLGRIDVLFEQNRKGKCISCDNVLLNNSIKD
jgi:5'-nucleotidase